MEQALDRLEARVQMLEDEEARLSIRQVRKRFKSVRHRVFTCCQGAIRDMLSIRHDVEMQLDGKRSSRTDDGAIAAPDEARDVDLEVADEAEDGASASDSSSESEED